MSKAFEQLKKDGMKVGHDFLQVGKDMAKSFKKMVNSTECTKSAESAMIDHYVFSDDGELIYFKFNNDSSLYAFDNRFDTPMLIKEKR